MENWGGVEETIIMNKYGAENTIVNWTDLTSYNKTGYAFIAHNIYFVWGDIHYDYHSRNSFVDRKVNVGCIFKEFYRKASDERKKIVTRMAGIRKEKKTVCFFGTNVTNQGRYTERFLADYMELIREFCERNKDINILFKPKREGNRPTKLAICDNFIYLSPSKCGVEEAIAISDVCITMGMTTPSIIALICGSNGLYFDTTENGYHPFARKYRDKIVFSDKELLFKQINNILSGKLSCSDVIGEKEIRMYDAFPDDNALERWRENLHELTLAHNK
jgi:polysaccharide biosynthesis PFTS motif protein